MKREQLKNWMLIQFVLLLLSLNVSVSAQKWGTVRAGGGGAITSITAHPKVPNLYFMTTDVGTPYRWNSTTQSWEGMFYNFPASYWGKPASGNVAFAPNDATGQILYATIGGAYASGTVMKSTDRGETWVDCNQSIDVQPNSDQKFGQRINVDPINNDIVIVTTRPLTGTDKSISGTFRTKDGGATWEKLGNLCGAFVVFDVSGGAENGATKRVYIGCADGVYVSNDGGNNFSIMTGSPANSWRAAIHEDGTLYITHYKSVSKWDGTSWISITPPENNIYSPVSVNPKNSQQVIVGINNSGSPYSFSQFLSNNGGTTWKQIFPVGDLTEVPWFPGGIGSGLKCFCWDPFDENMVWFGDWYHPYQTTNIWSGTNVSWKARAKGEEEIVTLGNILAPPSGDNIVHTCAADIGGWDHKSLTEPPAVGMVGNNLFPYSATLGGTINMTGVAVQETNPNFIARVGRARADGPGYCGYSTDGGTTYTKWTCPSDAKGGRIAVSADTTTMVWVTHGGPCYRSTNLGVNWVQITTLPSNIIVGANSFASGPTFPLAADKVNGNKFYVYSAGKFYVSTDRGATFTQTATLSTSYITNPLVVETNPAVEGDIWIAMNMYGLVHSTNSGTSFTKLSNVQYAYSVTIGKASPTSPTVPAIYVYGTVNNIANGLFRSNDNGVTWTLISSPIRTGLKFLSMSADRRVYGRVYFGTLGNGIMYMDAESDIIVPSAPTKISATVTSTTTARIIWGNATDNGGVASYNVYKDGVYVTNSKIRTYSASGLIVGRSYTFSVKTVDGAGNLSDAAAVTFTIPTTYSVPTNIALRKPISSSVANTTAPFAVDGDLSTGWEGASSVGNPLGINLQDKYDLTGAEIVWPHSDWNYRYKIEVSNDSTNWLMACNMMTSDYAGAPSEIVSFNAKGYQYVKFTVTGVGDGAYWVGLKELLLFGNLTSISATNNLTNDRIKIYPNPTSEFINITNLERQSKIQIFTLNGIMTYQKLTDATCISIPVSTWNRGVYLIKTEAAGQLLVQKIVIQ